LHAKSTSLKQLNPNSFAKTKKNKGRI
jgi:hypothetical protein